MGEIEGNCVKVIRALGTRQKTGPEPQKNYTTISQLDTHTHMQTHVGLGRGLEFHIYRINTRSWTRSQKTHPISFLHLQEKSLEVFSVIVLIIFCSIGCFVVIWSYTRISV